MKMRGTGALRQSSQRRRARRARHPSRRSRSALPSGVDRQAPLPTPEPGRYRDIGEHALIGDRHTAALVSTAGNIDWFCTPHFDSPSVFGRLLDHDAGGTYSIALDSPAANRQSYIPDTNVLVTRFLAPAGMAEIIDFMPLDQDPDTPPLHRIVRIVRVLRGSLTFRLHCQPAFDYGRRPHRTRRAGRSVRFVSKGTRLLLEGSKPLRIESGSATSRFTLRQGQQASFVLQTESRRRHTRTPPKETPDRLLEETVSYWRDWVAKCTYQGRWREQVHRSALLLKLLTYEPTGAIVAAPTLGLPETIGGQRNWDYRYCWIRDSAFIVRALLRIGFVEEADHFMKWLVELVEDGDETASLRPLYGVHGALEDRETILDHWEGYRGSRPVRVGNAAASHLQLDVYGALFDALCFYDEGSPRITHQLWRRLSFLLDWICDNWHKADRSIWEYRDRPRHFTFSKLMCWVALDRGLRLAQKRGLPAPRDRWLRERDRIYDVVMERGWSKERQAFTQVLDGSRLDSSLSLLPLFGFAAPRDPRVVSTLRAIQENLASGPLVMRHRLDDEGRRLGGVEGAFTPCGFWLAQALARAGDVETARRLFDDLTSFANHAGLFAEEIGPSGEALGNFPQGLTHLALIEAALEIDQALGRADA